MIIQKIYSYNEFLEYIEKYNHVIIHISASWCKPCISIKPKIENFINSIDKNDCIYLMVDYDVYNEFEELQEILNEYNE